RISLTTLQYQELGDLVDAIGLPKHKLCTYCWDGCDSCEGRQMSLLDGAAVAPEETAPSAPPRKRAARKPRR
ncbi:MAG TPA: hypothetical protein PKL84_01785, partial [Candidatus Hydrogenedentes bacterium]|nr:hypothetical protein [Candidatus Hydrogenedentota bacterium]